MILFNSEIKYFELLLTFERKPFLKISFITALPTDIAKGLPPKVDPCVPGTIALETFFVINNKVTIFRINSDNTSEILSSSLIKSEGIYNSTIVNSIKAEVALRLTAAGHPPKVLTAGAVVGAEKANDLFQSAYDEHGRRLAKYYADLGT